MNGCTMKVQALAPVSMNISDELRCVRNTLGDVQHMLRCTLATIKGPTVAFEDDAKSAEPTGIQDELHIIKCQVENMVRLAEELNKLI